jgi:hypothetical protein
MLTTPAEAYGVALIAVGIVCVAGLMTFGAPGKRDGALAITIIGFPVCLGALGAGE